MDLIGYEFPPIQINLDDYTLTGPVLDIGGGGEGVIGQLAGSEVIDIDRRMDELLEAPDGPTKLMMDARQLGFASGQFPSLTAFFSLMYISNLEDQKAVFAEAQRVLQPGGVLHLWDVTLPDAALENSDYYVVFLKYGIRGAEKGTGYGMRWPGARRDAAHYIALAEQAGLTCIKSAPLEHCFYLQFVK